MQVNELRAYYDRPASELSFDPLVHEFLLRALEAGEIRAAEKCPDSSWRAIRWVKEAILLGFRSTQLTDLSSQHLSFFDKPAYPPRRFNLDESVRLVPGGSVIRRGAFVARGVIVMPPAYINVGAFIGEATMVDSHALVGSCAQIGSRVHLSAGAQIGGVLEPAGATPVVVEDDAFIGGLVGLFEGIVVRSRAVVAPGVTMTASTTMYDLVHGREIRREVPEGAVVVPGTRPASGEYAKELGLSLNAPLIVKYRDSKTDASTALETALR